MKFICLLEYRNSNWLSISTDSIVRSVLKSMSNSTIYLYNIWSFQKQMGYTYLHSSVSIFVINLVLFNLLSNWDLYNWTKTDEWLSVMFSSIIISRDFLISCTIICMMDWGVWFSKLTFFSISSGEKSPLIYLKFSLDFF